MMKDCDEVLATTVLESPPPPHSRTLEGQPGRSRPPGRRGGPIFACFEATDIDDRILMYCLTGRPKTRPPCVEEGSSKACSEAFDGFIREEGTQRERARRPTTRTPCVEEGPSYREEGGP